MKRMSKRLQQLQSGETLWAEYDPGRWVMAWYESGHNLYYIVSGKEGEPAHWQRNTETIERLEAEMREFCNLRHWVVVS